MADSEERYDNLFNDLDDFSTPIFATTLTVLIIDAVALLAGFAGYFIHRKWITWFGHLILLLSCVVLTIVVGFRIAFMVVKIDFW